MQEDIPCLFLILDVFCIKDTRKKNFLFTWDVDVSVSSRSEMQIPAIQKTDTLWKSLLKLNIRIDFWILQAV
jgi:hypothetical protein